MLESGGTALRVLAPAKVNLSLFLGPPRADGRHELVTLFQSLALADELRVVAGGGTGDGAGDRVVCEPPIAGENLAARALAELRARGWGGPALEVSILKRIPVAAGMAGGSADAAATLRAAAALVPGRAEELEAVAAGLGADVPSQLSAGVALGTGAGEVVERFEPLAEHAYVVVPSPFALSTPAVYAEADRLGIGRTRPALADLHAALVAALAPGARLPDALLVNDLQAAAVSLCPWCGDALAAVREAGAEHALVSGSGPTVVGIWWGTGALARARQAATTLAARFPGATPTTPVGVEYALPALS